MNKYTRYVYKVNNKIHNLLCDCVNSQDYASRMDFKKKSGLHIKEARKRKQWTLQQLADQTKSLSASRISNYEQGIRSIDVPTAAELSTALGVSIGYILGIEDSELPLKADESALLNKYRSADKRGKDTIQSIADSQSVDPDQKASNRYIK